MNGEFQVSTYNHGTVPEISGLSDGGFVIAWDGGGEVFAQRYDANGAVNDVEFQVNTFTTSHQTLNSIAGLSDGGFVVTWASHEQAYINKKWGVYGQRYDANGAVTGAEFVVRSDASDRFIDSNTTALSDGSFIVNWDYNRGINRGTSGQYYDVNGAASGTEFIHRFASSFNNNGSYPSYEATALKPGHAFGGNDGGFVVTWVDPTGYYKPSLKGKYAQYYEANAAVSSTGGYAFRINSKVTLEYGQDTNFDHLTNEIVIPLDNGFVSTFQKHSSPNTFYAQRYNESGIETGAEIRTKGLSTTALSDGGFVVNYPKYGKDGYKEGVYAQRYDANGAVSGAEFKVYTASETTVQSSPDFAALSDGGLVSTWHTGPNTTNDKVV